MCMQKLLDQDQEITVKQRRLTANTRIFYKDNFSAYLLSLMKFFCETVLYYQLNSVEFQNNSLNDSVYLKNTEYVENYNLICLVNYFLKLKHEIRKEEKLPHHITDQEFRKETLTFF